MSNAPSPGDKPAADLAVHRRRIVHTIVWGVWLAMSVWAGLYISHYARNVPYWDDWALVPAYVGETPVTEQWLWSQHNEHRIPLPKLVIVGLLRLTGDTRSGMVFNVCLLSGLAALGLYSFAKARGYTVLSDALIPLLLLHTGHFETYLWLITVQNAIFAALAAYLLFTIARYREPQREISLMRFGVVLLALPLCGGAGIAMAPFLALWLLGLAMILYRSGDVGSRWRVALAIGCAVTVFALVGAYFYGYTRPAYHPPPKSMMGVLLVTTRFLASGFGGGVHYWPDTGLAAIVLTGFSLYLLARTLLTRREELPRALGLTLFLAGCGATAFAVGWGRSGMSSQTGSESKYLVFSVLFVLSMYAIWTLCLQSLERRRLLCTAVLVAVCLTTVRSYYAARAYGRIQRALWTAFEDDARTGATLEQLAGRHNLFPDRKSLQHNLALLEKIGHGAMKDRTARFDLQHATEFAANLSPVTSHNIVWSGTAGDATGPDPYAVFQLDAPKRVLEARIEVEMSNPENQPAQFQVYWDRTGQTEFAESRSFQQSIPVGKGPQTVTVRIGEEVDRLRLDPDIRDCRIVLKSLTLLVEPGAEVARRSESPESLPRR